MSQDGTRAGSELSGGLGAMIERLERESFEKWYATHAFDFEKNPIGSRDCGLQWQAWQARGRLIQPCRGARREGCSYLAPCGAPCDKCGQIH